MLGAGPGQHMDLTVAWVVFPLVLAVLCIGAGLMVERLTGLALPGALVPAVGLAAIVVEAQFLTLWDLTAEVATPATVARRRPGSCRRSHGGVAGSSPGPCGP